MAAICRPRLHHRRLHLFQHHLLLLDPAGSASTPLGCCCPPTNSRCTLPADSLSAAPARSGSVLPLPHRHIIPRLRFAQRALQGRHVLLQSGHPMLFQPQNARIIECLHLLPLQRRQLVDRIQTALQYHLPPLLSVVDI